MQSSGGARHAEATSRCVGGSATGRCGARPSHSRHRVKTAPGVSPTSSRAGAPAPDGLDTEPGDPVLLPRCRPGEPRERGRPGSHASRRTLHLIDALNLSDGERGAAAVLCAVDRYLVTAGWHPGDTAVVGVPTAVARHIAWSLPPGVALRCGRRPHAGRFALLGYASDPDQVARSYVRVVIGSGDGEFAPLAERLAALGVEVRIVSTPGAAAYALVRVADRRGTFPTPSLSRPVRSVSPGQAA